MNEPAATSPTNPNDARVQAALEDYFERIDRHEPLDREAFLAKHSDIADELALFISTEDEVVRFAAESRVTASHVSTDSFSHQTAETQAPRTKIGSSAPTKSGQLSGRFGRYRIVRSLGQGAMGTVYLAEDTQLQRPVALKTPQFTEDSEEELLQRFYREARAAALLRHPRICPVYDVGDIDGQHYITMAYIEGLSLSEFVNPPVPQTEQQILICVGKIAQALQEAHNHGIVHRDLKPANIMVDRQGEPVIMDFGLAQQMRPGEDVRLTQTGMIVGSPAYMSPEMVEGEASKVGPAADQYGLGVILYELITGQVPFVGSMSSVLGQILTKQPTPPSRYRPGLDPRIDAACLKMLAKDPKDRFPSLTAVADELATIVRTPPPERTVKVHAPQLNKKSTSPWQKWAVGSVAAAAIAGMLAGVILYLRAGKVLVEVQVDDPGVEVALRGSSLTVKGPSDEEIKVEPGEHELTITHGDLKFKTDTFTLEKGSKQIVKVSLVGANLAAKLNDAPLPLAPISTTGSADGASPAQSEEMPFVAFPFGPHIASRAQEAWAGSLKIPVETTNSIGMKLRLIPPGEYMMGPYEGHHVRLTRPCYFGAYEVTRGQFAQFAAATGFRTVAEGAAGGMRLENVPTHTKYEHDKKHTWRDPGFAQDDDHPVVQVTWQDAVSFCEWLSKKEGKKYRLPTEAEFEFACRAGTLTRYYNGNDLQSLTQIGNVADAAAKTAFPKWDDGVTTSDGYIYTSPVGRFRPNNFGLYDMLGNVNEWCSDWYAAEYDKDAKENPTGPSTGNAHVGRGGGFTHVAGSRYRYFGNDTFRRPDWGFRVVCEIPAEVGAEAAQGH